MWFYYNHLAKKRNLAENRINLSCSNANSIKT